MLLRTVGAEKCVMINDWIPTRGRVNITLYLVIFNDVNYYGAKFRLFVPYVTAANVGKKITFEDPSIKFENKPTEEFVELAPVL